MWCQAGGELSPIYCGKLPSTAANKEFNVLRLRSHFELQPLEHPLSLLSLSDFEIQNKYQLSNRLDTFWCWWMSLRHQKTCEIAVKSILKVSSVDPSGGEDGGCNIRRDRYLAARKSDPDMAERESLTHKQIEDKRKHAQSKMQNQKHKHIRQVI